MTWIILLIALAVFIVVAVVFLMVYIAEDVTPHPDPGQWGPPPVFRGSPRVVALAQALYPRLLGTMFTITTTPSSMVIQTRRDNIVREYATEREAFDEERVVILHDRPEGCVREDRIIRHGTEQGPKSTSKFSSGFMGTAFSADLNWEVWRDERGKWVKRRTSGPNLDSEIHKAMKETGVKFAPFKFKEQDTNTQIGCVAAILGLTVALVVFVVPFVL